MARSRLASQRAYPSGSPFTATWESSAVPKAPRVACAEARFQSRLTVAGVSLPACPDYTKANDVL